MVLPFQEIIINDKEYSNNNFQQPNFIGYLNPYGIPIEYSNPLGLGGHDCDRTTLFFETYFRMPENEIWLQQLEGIDSIDFEHEKDVSKSYREFFIQRKKDTIEHYKKYGKSKNARVIFQDDMDTFFLNCFQANTFTEGFNQNTQILNHSEYYDKYFIERRKKLEQKMYSDEEIGRISNSEYIWYKKRLMLDWYKTVIVQYMHYHLIERCNKGITTSDIRPYETFYNYILNDFEIHQIPRMIYDSSKKMYVPYMRNEFLIPESELILKQELESIKKLVPLKERNKYYR